MIRKLSYTQIDFDKYQHCLENSEQYLFFAEKKYLDALIGKNWDLLVLNDYEAVMPVPLVYKLGISFVIMPMQTQQLGVFSSKDSKELNQKFSDFLQKHYRVFYYAFNAHNQFEPSENYRWNFILKSGDYSTIKKNYSVHRRRNVRITEALKDKIQIVEPQNMEHAESFFMKNSLEKSEVMNKKFFSNMKKLHSHGLIQLFELHFQNQLVSMAYLVKSKSELFLVNFINDKAYSKYNVSSILIDQILQKEIENKQFNFHGSSIPAIADFYRRFGAEETQYHFIENSKKKLLKKALSFK